MEQSNTGPKQDAKDVARKLASVSATTIATAHTLCATAAFALALGVALFLHYERVVKNQFFGHPQEWFPSVSAAVGDWYPERNVFHILIALTATPRFGLVLCAYLLSRRPHSSIPGLVAICGLTRTLACAGWVYITSSDNHNWHDLFMISYIVLNIPWMVGSIYLTDLQRARAKQLRLLYAAAFFGSLPPLIYYYLQHKLHRVAGAYSIYALFEWALIIADVAFDSVWVMDFARLEVWIVDVGRSHAEGSSGLYLAPTLNGVVVNNTTDLPSAFSRTMSRVGTVTAPWRHFLADSYLALIFWSNLTALGPMIFYQSVWSMGLSGDEVLLLVTLSPAFLLIPSARRMVFRWSAFLHLITLGGVAAYLLDDDGKGRLRILAGTVGVGCMLYAAQWWDARDNPEELEIQSVTFLVGLILSVLLKHANFSLNPLWPIMKETHGENHWTGGAKGVALCVGVLACLDKAFAAGPVTVKLASPPPPEAKPGPTASSSPPPPETKPGLKPQSPPAPPNSSKLLFASLGFGALFFLLHLLFTDAGTIIAWSWEGYPIRGPTAMPHGVLTILALVAGLLLSSYRSVVSSYTSFAAACIGALALYFTKGWSAFVGGLALGIWAAAIFPSLLAAIASHNPGAAFFVAFLVYLVLELANVWTVAYAFVPGGVYLRERTDLVLIVTMGLLGVGVVNLQRPGAVASLPPSVRILSFTKRLKSMLVTILIISVAVAYHRRRIELPLPYHADARLVTAAIWTMHFSLDGRMWESQRRIADIIRDAEIDIIGLLESDLQRIVAGNRDMTQFVSSTLNMYADIGPSPSSHTWGCALLSKFPILNSTHHLLPSPNGELAPAIHATLDIYGTWVDVIVAHNGQEEDALDRELQSQELARMMREAWPRPVIFLGYVVTKPLDVKPAPYQILVEDGRVHDVDPTDMDRWCEYIFFRGLHRVAYAHITRGEYSKIPI